MNDDVSKTWSRPFEPPEKIPDAVDVVIIGGGIVGVCTAWFLSRSGVKVALCEKGHIAGEQSSRNWGWVRQQARDPREMPMIMESLRIWRRMESLIGEDVGFEEAGCVFLANTEKRLEKYATWLDVAREFDLETRIVRGDDLEQQVPGASGRWAGAMYTPSDGRAEPHKAAPAIARTASRLGAHILTSCAVRGIDIEGGKVSGVITEHGRIKTPMVLCAAGAWTSMFCRSLGISVPQLKVRGTVARTAPADKVLNGTVFEDRIGIRRRQDGGYTIAHGAVLDHGITPSTFRYAFKFMPALMQEIRVLRPTFGKDFFDELRMPKRWSMDAVSPFEKTRVLNPPPNQRVLKKLRVEFDQTFPGIAGTEFVEAWAGMVETSPDVVPIISEDPNLSGFFIATGFSGHGFGIGPGAGKAIAGMLTNTDSGIDLSAFKLSRFFDGSPIRPQPSI
jgi:glycine/D-amino acid oxidase-like deaminating enzyme